MPPRIVLFFPARSQANREFWVARRQVPSKVIVLEWETASTESRGESGPYPRLQRRRAPPALPSLPIIQQFKARKEAQPGGSALVRNAEEKISVTCFGSRAFPGARQTQ